MDTNSPDNPDAPLPPDEISPEVAAILAESATDQPSEAQRIELDPSVAQDVREALTPPTEAGPRIEVPIPPAFQPGNNNIQSLIEWVFSSDKLRVDVSEAEKGIYWKGMLTDEPVVFTIDLEGLQPLQVRVQNLTTFGQHVAAGAMALDEAEGVIVGVESAASMMQQYAIMLQVMAINNAPFDGCQLDDVRSLSAAVPLLREKTQRVMWRMNAARLNMLVKAVTIYEIKMKLCNDAVANRKEEGKGFWQPPDTV